MTKTPLNRPLTRLRLPRRRLLGHLGAAGGALLLGPRLIGPARAAKMPDTLRFGLSSYPPSLSPWENTGTASATVKLQMFRGLLGYDANGEIRSEIADSYEVEGDRTYVFKLRPNAVFQNGEPVTSANVKFTYEAIADEGSTAYLRDAFQIVSSIETPDEHTVRITLEQPSAPFIFLCASFFTHIVSQKAFEQDPANPVGAGPYRIASIERGTRIDMEAFPEFYKEGLPKTPKLSFISYEDENLRVAGLEAGDVDLIEYVPWQNMDMIEANPDLQLDSVDGPFMYLIFNAESGPFANPKVREAVAYAVRREDIIAAAFFGRGSPLLGMPVPQSSPYYDEELGTAWNHDPEKAKALLAEAGATGVTGTLLSTAQYGMHKDTAEIVQQQLAAVGINVQLNLPDWPTRVDLGNKGQYDIGVMGSAGDYNDPDALSNFLDGRLAPSFVRSYGFNDPKINELLDSGRSELDQAKREEIYDQLQAQCLESVPLVGINWRTQGYASQTYVESFKNMPGFLTFYSGSMIEETAIV